MSALGAEPRPGLAGGGIVGHDMLAPAKINLALHVLGRRADGYHDLDSLVVFAETGDRLDVSPAEADALSLSGFFASDLPDSPRNILLEALTLAREVARDQGEVIGPLAIRLDKRLPVASGIGGGSADAAALLRIVAAARPRLRAALAKAAARLGADVPMCLDRHPVRVGGTGDIIRPITAPGLPLILVNPGVAVPTPAVFAALEVRENPPMPPMPDSGFADSAGLIDHLHQCRNDLQAPAISLAPVIDQVKACLMATGSPLVRMSGSGATMVAVYLSLEEARAAAAKIAAEQPSWWVRAGLSFASAPVGKTIP